jgi:hypothetical protein
MAERVPQSASSVFDVAVHSIAEQLARIDSLDSKAGILLAADGVLAGLIFVRGGVVASAPLGLALVVSVTILLSLLCTLVSFADREYLARPRAETVEARWLTFGQGALLVTLLSLGSYFIYELVRDA